jgi:hypothetical protein
MLERTKSMKKKGDMIHVQEARNKKENSETVLHVFLVNFSDDSS